jgi:hypothetical protein
MPSGAAFVGSFPYLKEHLTTIGLPRNLGLVGLVPNVCLDIYP